MQTQDHLCDTGIEGTSVISDSEERRRRRYVKRKH